MSAEILIKMPRIFSFRHTVGSHGWYDLAPFHLDLESMTLVYTFAGAGAYGPLTGKISADDASIRVQMASPDFDLAEIAAAVRHILRLDEEFDDFYAIAKGKLNWVAQHNAGRLLRSPTVFEDAVKTLCTTNCSWGLTRNMVTNLVQKLGELATDGGRAFPTPHAMAGVDTAFYREEIRTGYRSPYFHEFANAVASGDIDPESWLTSDLQTADLKKQIKQIKGFGDYAAENLLKLLGRYDGLALDSWLRAKFYERHNKSRKCADSKIERHYRTFGKWKGLAIWCDMTENWFEP